MDRSRPVCACRLRGGPRPDRRRRCRRGPTRLGLLNAFRLLWKLAPGLGVVLAVVTGGLARVVLPHVLSRPKFEAEAVLLVAVQPPQVLFTTERPNCGKLTVPVATNN